MKIKLEIKSLLSRFLVLVIGGFLVVLCWIYNNDRASKRDYEKKLRDIRISYLIDAYRKIADCSQRTVREHRQARTVLRETRLRQRSHR